MAAANLSAVLHGAKDLRLEDYPVLEPKSGEVQLKVQRCGVCMTDVHLRDDGRVGCLVLREPVVIGHEYSGIVTQLGSDVSSVAVEYSEESVERPNDRLFAGPDSNRDENWSQVMKAKKKKPVGVTFVLYTTVQFPGDRVVVDVLVPCGQCLQCKTGRSNVCAKQCLIGVSTYGRGGMTRLTTLPAGCIHRIPDSVDFEEAALIEPLSVCVSAVNRLDVKVGDDVIVIGAGPLGLMTLQAVLAKGASRVCMADINEDRLKLARELGAALTVQFREDETDAQANAQTLKDTLGNSADVGIDCTGVALCMKTIIYTVRSGGVAGILGLGPDDVTLPIMHATLNEIDIRGCVANNYCFPTAIKLVASGKVKLKPIISHHAKLEDLHSALELVEKRQVMKIVLDCSGDKQ